MKNINKGIHIETMNNFNKYCINKQNFINKNVA